MSEINISPRILGIIAIGIMLAMFTAYMIFLTFTWQQLQNDRRAAFAKVDDLIDRLPKVPGDKPAEHI